MGRKTIDVEYMKAFANSMLAGTDPKQKDVRLGVSLMLEEILHRTGNYKGFKYNDYDARIESPNFDDTQRTYF